MKHFSRLGTVVAALLCALAPSAIAFQKPDLAEIPDFDARVSLLAPPPARAAAAQRLRAETPEIKVEFDERTGSPKMIAARRGFLTGLGGQVPSVAATNAAAPVAPVDPRRPVELFVDEHHELFGHGSEILRSARLVRDYTTPHSGMHTWVWQQELDGIEVFEGVFSAHTTRDGALIAVSSQLLADAPAAANAGAANPATRAIPLLDAAQAALNAASSLGEVVAPADLRLAEDAPGGADRRTSLTAPTLNRPSEARLVWLPMSEALLSLCWEVTLTSRARGETWLFLVDAQTGEVVIRRRLTVYLSDATFNVFTSDSPSPFSPGLSTPSSTQPPFVSRVLVTLPALDTNASPAGWIDDGVNETRGNNVDAHTDRDANNAPDLPRPQGSPFRVFDFAQDLTQAPSTYTNASVVQLFYWCNWIHDRLYEVGFTEGAGNFQNNNFGRGGAGNDAVQADAQDGSGVNNANFTPTSDGSAPRIQMYVFNGPTPDRDGDLDAEVVLHEYTHGLSTRLVGGGSGIGALQTAGMGEGWSDWYALTLLSEPGDDLAGNYPEGGYVTYQLSGLTQNYYFGIRRYPYSTDLTKNPLTFKDIDPGQASAHTGIPRSPIIGSTASEVHNQGEVWCVTLWEARANLIAKYGYATGNQLILQLVTDGMKLSPPNPNFLQARDAILLADQVLTGGANRAQLWAGFAKRGMGVSATSPPSSTTTGVHEAYDFPDDLVISPAAGFTASGPVGGPFSPASQIFTLTNSGANPLNWAAGSTVNWLTLSSTSGSLSPGGSAQAITVSVDVAANSLPTGIYSSFVHFTNLTSGAAVDRQFWLLAGPPPFEDDFEPGIDLPQWAVLGDIVLATNYGGSVSGTHSLWFNGAGTRLAASRPINALLGGTIDFALRLGNSTAPWEFVDLPGEGIVLEYSTNSGLSWIEMGRFDTEAYRDWTLVSLDLPAGAQAPAAQFRWRQLSHSGNGFDNWALDDVRANIGPQPPRIRSQPGSLAIFIGETARFDVVASGTVPLAYQWLKNDSQITGATNMSYSIVNAQTNDAGLFYVVVTNNYGMTTSAVVALTVSPPPPCIPPPTDLAAWWRGEDNGADTAGTNTATLFGGTSFLNGKVGRSFAFDGTNGYLIVASSPATKPTGPFTVEAWAYHRRLSGPNGDCIVAKGVDAETPVDWALSISSVGKLRPHVRVGGSWVYFDCATMLSTGTWYHVALVYDGANLRGYLNGNQDGSQPVSGALQATDNSLRIGAYAPINGTASKCFFPGQIDEVSLYQRALSPSEIQAIYNASVSGKCFSPSAPVIFAQPQSQTVFAGADVQFTVTASGTPPLSYQWNFNASPLADQTNNTLLLASVTTNNSGMYSVTITNLYGPATSSNALLTVNPVPLCVVPPTNLVGWWRADGNADDAAADRNGTLNGGAAFVPGRAGQAFDFNGTSSYVSIPDSELWAFDTNDFSIEFWARFKTRKASTLTSPEAVFVANDQGAGIQNKWFFALGGGVLNFHVNGPGPGAVYLAQAPFSPTTNQWYHLAIVRSGNVFTIYRDGLAVGSQTNALAIPDADAPLTLGTAEGVGFLSGALDEVSIYRHALSAGEIQAIYSVGSSAKCAVLLPPQIYVQPQDQSVAAGLDVLFHVAAAGSAPLSYQWFHNGAMLPGRTNPSLTLSAITTDDAGSYFVIVSNAVAVATSSNAQLTVGTACTTPLSGLVAWWQAESNALDVARGQSGRLFNTEFLPGKVGQAFQFNGTNAYVEVPSTAALKPTGPFSVEGWINYDRQTGGNGDVLVSKGQDAESSQDWALAVSSVSKLRPHVQAGGWNYFDCATTLSTGVWYHVAMVYDGSNLRGYVNGVQDGVTAASGAVQATDEPLRIGAYAPVNGTASKCFFAGRVDELSIYNRALSPGEIQALYLAGGPGKCVSGLPPFVLTQPQNQTAAAGSAPLLSVEVTGGAPFAYQWRLNGAPIPGGTNATLAFAGVTTNQTGLYSVAISNAAGYSISSNATLTVLEPGTGFYDDFEPDIDLPQWSAFGGTVGTTVIATNFGGSVSGSHSLWFGDAGTRFAATRSIDTLSGGTIAFSLRFAASNSPVWETVDLPAKGVVLEYSTDGGANWTQMAACTVTNFYNWTQVATNLPAAARTSATQFRWRQLTHSGTGFDHWALDDVLISATALPVIITNQPSGTTALLGTAAAFTVGVSGAPPIAYQWYSRNTLLPLKTNSTLVVSNVGFADAGPYFVTVNNPYGSATSVSAFLTLLRPGPVYSFTNSTAIQIPVGADAAPYPATLGVVGITGTVANVTVTLNNLTHSSPNDLDVLLVGPGGQKAIILSDAIGTNSQALSNVTLTFDDHAAGFLPEFGIVSPGTFRPTDYPPGDSFPAPAPAPPYATNLNVFIAGTVNGTWSLYIVDDQPASNGGVVAGGWQLSIQVARTVGPRFAQPAPGANGFQLIFYSPDGQPYTLNDLAYFTAEVSSNLFNWETLPAALTLLPDGRIQIVDTNYPTARRFYRVSEH